MPRSLAALVALTALACGSSEKSAARDQTAAPPDPALASPDPAPALPGGFVDVTALDPTIRLDIRYATTDNFANAAVYPVARCLLRRPVAERLVAVQESLAARGLGLLMWDCYRPLSVQERFWELVPDPRYVARPRRAADGTPVDGSKHNRGAAVDLTLVDEDGAPLEMPTDYDDFSERAHVADERASEEARRNAAVLRAAMEREGFTVLPTEWWHFDGPDWESYPLADVPLEAGQGGAASERNGGR